MFFGCAILCVVGLIWAQLKVGSFLVLTTSLNGGDMYPDPTSLLSYQQSFGFFDDIADDEWKMLQSKVKEMYPNTNGDPFNTPDTNSFYLNHYEIDFGCHHERRLGRRGDGGKWVCDPHRLRPHQIGKSYPALSSPGMTDMTMTDVSVPPCLVYSIGSNGDPSFEADIKNFIGPHCEIHVFDMDDYSAEVSSVGANFHQWGLSHENVDNGKHVFKTLQQTMQELGHIGRPINIFKIDCESCEYQLVNEFFQPGVDLRQILIELHGDTKKMADFFQAMYNHGYVISHKEPALLWIEYIEYSFVKLHRNFFQDIPQLYQVIA